jgi:hypothetical protein
MEDYVSESQVERKRLNTISKRSMNANLPPAKPSVSKPHFETESMADAVSGTWFSTSDEDETTWGDVLGVIDNLCKIN